MVMSEIKAGDTAFVVAPTTCCNKWAERSIVSIKSVSDGKVKCMFCKTMRDPSLIHAQAEDGLWIELKRLKKIPPLNELEDQTEERKVEV
jgi:hypothetical protein